MLSIHEPTPLDRINVHLAEGDMRAAVCEAVDANIETGHRYPLDYAEAAVVSAARRRFMAEIETGYDADVGNYARANLGGTKVLRARMPTRAQAALEVYLEIERLQREGHGGL